MLAAEILNILSVSLKVSLSATLAAALVSVPIGIGLGWGRFPGRNTLVTVLKTLMALPTVVVGLLLYGLFSRLGPLGFLKILYTPAAMAAGQFVLALPIISSLTCSAIEGLDPRVRRTALTLGASRFQAALLGAREAKLTLLAAIAAGFGRVVTEVGSAIMLGGNIKDYTRTMTTAITLETAKGEFELGIYLGFILLAVALGLNLAVAKGLESR
ncbi:MAG: ABC transporter permease subunit [Deltaproteobacteria bacterium]|nr:ABC transporter permease subunit [Deltaproteobacteria bacterium]